MNFIFLYPLEESFKDVMEAVKGGVTDAGHTIFFLPNYIMVSKFPENSSLKKAISNCDLVIADISKNDAKVIFEIGFAKSLGKPVYFIADNPDSVLFHVEVLVNSSMMLYDRNKLHSFRKSLSKNSKFEEIVIGDVIEEKQTVFISYSHKDVSYLERLRVHFKPLEKRGVIDLWSDTKIKAGERWKESIMKALDRAKVAILLISADFLASDFITDNELPLLLKAAENNGKQIIPVIIKPCRFTVDEHLSAFQAINEPKTPLSKMDESDREEIYVKIVDTIDNLLKT